MASRYWLKLYYEMLDDPKMGQLRPALRWRFIECLLVAGENGEDGYLPDIGQYSWRVRDSSETVETDFVALADAGLLSQDNGDWKVTKFAERQAAVGNTERWQRWRDRQRQQEANEEQTNFKREQTETPTKRLTDKNRIDTEENRIDTEEKKSKNGTGPLPDTPADYQMIRQHWLGAFPDKPKPRAANKTLQGKVKTRLKSPHFRDNWPAALDRAAQSEFLKTGEWFDFGWFVKNDDNYEKCLTGKYDDRQNGQHPAEPAGFQGIREIREEIKRGNA